MQLHKISGILSVLHIQREGSDGLGTLYLILRLKFWFFKTKGNIIFFQVIEFVQFKERLQHSNQYLVARVEAPILQLKQNADNIEDEEVMYVGNFCMECLCFLMIDNRFMLFCFF